MSEQEEKTNIKVISRIAFKESDDLEMAIELSRMNVSTELSSKIEEMAALLQIPNYFIGIELDKGMVSIEKRASYCDRGRFIVKVDSYSPIEFHIDNADMFPRYYFDIYNLLSEIARWFKARKVKIISMELKTLSA